MLKIFVAVNENDAMNVQFSSILRGATELVAEIDLVKHQMSPCFPPHWSVEVLWSSCVLMFAQTKFYNKLEAQQVITYVN